MGPEQLAHWKAADAAFDHWLDQSEAGRDAWLAAQAFPAPVRQRLQQLVAAHRKPRRSMDPGNGLAGQRLGDWTLESELGRGGMAVVHRAWREAGMARQEAAVKVLTLGALGATGRDRFRREAVILARLNHPNITTLLDSGVADDGTCWLAMPLVEGERIDRWCEAREPDAGTVVRLALQVCNAVAFAHRNLVVHRDLKPSNVLVDAGGHVHLLDFGIGQFTDTTDERTQTLWRALTPGYAAPEQLAGAEPSTAVDIYGLGALLHRLLTGRTPLTEGTETTRPSLLVRNAGDAYHRHYVPLKSDLDRVLLKALAEDPEQRYATAEALADDLRRWLSGAPVLAQEPTLGYRLRKFASRNKVGVAAGVLLAATLAAGIGATLWQAAEARRAADQALTQERRATAARDFMVQLFEGNDPDAGVDGPLSARDLLDQGAHRIRGAFAETPALRAEMLVLLGDLYRRIGELDAAAPLVDEGLQLAQDVDAAVAVEAMMAKGLLAADANRQEEALAAYDAAGRMFEAAKRVPGELHGMLVMHRGQLLSRMGRTSEATAYAEAALERARASTTLPPEGLFYYLQALSFAVQVENQMQRSEELLTEAIGLRSVDRLPPTSRILVNSNLASFALARGELDTALQRSSTALELARKVYLPLDRELASLLDGQGIIYTHMARFDEAVQAIEEAIRILESREPDNFKHKLSAAYNNLALALDNAERDAEAEAHMIRALELTGEAFGKNDPRYAIAVANLGNLYRQSGRYEEADALLGEGLRLRREILGADHPYFAHGLVQIARLRLRQGRPAEALDLAEQAAAVYAAADYKDPRRLASTDGVRAVAMAGTGRVDQAVALYDKAIAGARAAGVDNGVEWPRVMAARAELFVRHVPHRAREAVGEAVEANLGIYGETHPGTRQMLALAASLD